MKITLEKPSMAHVASYLDFVAEMRENGEKVWENVDLIGNEEPKEFVARMIKAETDPEPGLVEDSNFWAVDEKNVVVGRVSLRHRLNKHLEEFGGHIGYETRPSARRLGVASQMLELTLQTPTARKIGRLMLTCDPMNVASRKTIEKNGGVFEREAFVTRVNRATLYFWITLND